MTDIVASAPGKLFLLGEYAVLEGAPALLTAVDRRVSVTITRPETASWQLHAPDLGLPEVHLGEDGALPTSLPAPARATLRLFDAVRAAVAGQPNASVPRSLTITTDSSALSQDGHKLGLGSSAAVAVALTAALARAAGLRLDRAEVCGLASSAHRAAQDGAGSGGDVAASTYGGLLSFVREDSPAPLHWPTGLTMMVVITGTGSSTSELVRRVGDYAHRDPTGYRVDLARLTGLAERAHVALRSADRFLELAGDYFDALRLLDVHAHAGIVTERHLELHALARRHSAVFKTSGAGGGDVGLAFSRSGAPARELAASLAAAGADVVPLGFGAAGLEDGI
ncbi:phosphomevalonate kinase [Parafrigoribacterium mesophilum]|uniref:mevalonate kinase family protein n=1 Tax=Parafrigoribacterium mesophilum TaxID=433646 RepID=UPI0031FD3BEE